MRSSAWKLTDDKLESVPCPLCGGQSFTVLATTDRYRMGLTTAACDSCGFVMTNPQPKEAALDEFYTTHYRAFYQRTDEPSPEYVRQFRKDERSTKLAEYLDSRGLLVAGGRVLDIGAAEGSVLHALVRQQPTLKAVAVEPNPLFGTYAAANVPCSVFPTLEALEQSTPRPFDLIVVNHVFEHVKSPRSFLKQARRLLADGGSLYIDVPDLRKYQNLGSLHIAHLLHFDADSLRRVLELEGFDVLALEEHVPIGHPPSVRTVAKSGVSANPGRAARALPAVREDASSLIRGIQRRSRLYFLQQTLAWKMLAKARRLVFR